MTHRVRFIAATILVLATVPALAGTAQELMRSLLADLSLK